MQKVLLVHGWDGGPDKDWFPWLAAALKNRGYDVIAPQLPDAHEPSREKWIPALRTAIRERESDMYFVAHSMGCQTLLRYLAELPEGITVPGALFVAGFVKPLRNLEGSAEEKVAASWTSEPLDLYRVKAHLAKSVALFSDNDPWVGLDNADLFRDKLGADVVIESGREHFNEHEEPSVLNAFLRLVGA